MKRLLGSFFRTVGHDLAGVHNRARENRAQTGLLNRADSRKRALRARIEEIMFAHGRHAAADRLDAAEQAAGVKMFGPQHSSAAVYALEPRHQLEIFPDRAQ